MNNLREGGNAVGAVDRIPQKNINPTIQAFANQVLSQVPHKGFSPIGSTGKKPDNGDIDLGLETELSLQEIGDILDGLGVEHVVNTGLGEVSSRFPQYDDLGEVTDKFAQIDLMVGPQDWMEFMFFVPGPGISKFKPMTRTGLMYGLLRYGANPEPTDDGSVIQWSLSPTRGIMKKKGVARINKKGVEVIDWKNITDYEPSPDRFCEVAFEQASFTPKGHEMKISYDEMWGIVQDVFPREIVSKLAAYVMRFCKAKDVSPIPQLQEFILPEDLQSLDESKNLQPILSKEEHDNWLKTYRPKFASERINEGAYKDLSQGLSLEEYKARKAIAGKRAANYMNTGSLEGEESYPRSLAAAGLDLYNDPGSMLYAPTSSMLNEAVEGLIVDERNHGTHAEDMVLYGAKGIDFALNTLDEMFEELKGNTPANRKNITIKIDGGPVVIAGSSFAGIDKPFVANKAFIGEKEANEGARYATNDEELQALYGDRPGLLIKMKALLDIVPKLGIPAGEAWRGDFLFGPKIDGTKSVSVIEKDGEKLYAFHPVTIQYTVPVDSEVGRRVARAEMGVAWHTKYKGESIATAAPDFSVRASDLNDIPEMFSLDHRLDNLAGVVTLTAEETDMVEKALGNCDVLAHELISQPDYEVIISNSSFIHNFFMTFQNNFLRERRAMNPDEFVDGLILWGEKRFEKEISKLKKDSAIQGRLDKLAQYHTDVDSWRNTLNLMVKLMVGIANIKDVFVKKLNAISGIGTNIHFLSTDTWQPTSHEGYFVSDIDGNSIKLVDRQEFTTLAFNPDTEKGWQTEAKMGLQEKVSPDTFKKIDATVNKLNWVIDQKVKGEEDLFNKTTLQVRGDMPPKKREKPAKAFQQMLADEKVNADFTMMGTTPTIVISDDVGFLNLQIKANSAMKNSAENENSAEAHALNHFSEEVAKAVAANNGKPINIQIDERFFTNIVDVAKVPGAQPKADFALVDKKGNWVGYVSHKAPPGDKHPFDFRQYSGFAKTIGNDHPDAIRIGEAISNFLQGQEYPDGLRFYAEIPSPEVRRLAIYGPDFSINKPSNVHNIDCIVVGSISLVPSGQKGEWKLTAPFEVMSSPKLPAENSGFRAVYYIESAKSNFHIGSKTFHARPMIYPWGKICTMKNLREIILETGEIRLPARE
jgi:hypothetical protein